MTGGIEGGGPTLDRDKVYEEVTFGLRSEWQEGARYTNRW